MNGVRGDVLEVMVAYMKSHRGVVPAPIDVPLKSLVMSEVCTNEFDAKFIDQVGENKPLLFDLVNASVSIGLKSLLELACAKVASQLHYTHPPK